MFNSQHFQSWTFRIAAVGFAKVNSNPSVFHRMAGGFSAIIICFISTSLSAQWVTGPIAGRVIPVQSASYNTPLNVQPSISLVNYASTPTFVTSALPNSTFANRDFARLVGEKPHAFVGSVQIGLDTPPNQPHRADIKKMLVHRVARKRGIGAALLQGAEAEAKARSRTLLVLDTASGDAERLYARAGWQRVGVIPDYAQWPGGGFCDTTVFWKKV